MGNKEFFNNLKDNMKDEDAEKILNDIYGKTAIDRFIRNKLLKGMNPDLRPKSIQSYVDEIREAVQYGIKIANERGWHNLRKNPNDLPSENGQYLILQENNEENPPVVCEFDTEAGYFGYWKGYFGSGLGYAGEDFVNLEDEGYEKPIAWTEIPDFNDNVETEPSKKEESSDSIFESMKNKCNCIHGRYALMGRASFSCTLNLSNCKGCKSWGLRND